MLQARQVSWRNSLREIRRHVACSSIPEIRHFSTSKRSLARHTPIDSPFAPQLIPRLHPRSFATSQIRRKDKDDKDDVPDAIPEAPEKDEQSDKEKPQSVSEKEVEREARKESGHGSSIKTIDPKGSAGASGAGGESGGGDGSGSGFGRRGKRSMVPAKPSVPDIYPQVLAIPIAKRPLFPGFYKAFTIKDPNVAAALNEMIKRGQPYVGVFVFKDENLDKDTIDHPDEVYDVGVFAQITSQFPVHGEETSLTAVLYPHRRIRITSLIPPNKAKGEQFATASIEQQSETASEGQEVVEEAPPTPPPTPPATEPTASKELSSKDKEGDVVASFEEGQSAPSSGDGAPYDPTSFLRDFPVSLVNVENIPEQPWDKKNNVIRAVTNEIVNVFKDVANLNPLFRDQISTFSVSQSAGNIMDEPGKLADFAAAVSSGEVHELQEVLETMDVEKRVQKALEVLKKELMNAQLQNKISKDVEGKIQKRQREYWLMEQMKGIRRELGIESDGKDKLVEKFREKASKLAMPEPVKKVFDEELNKLAHLEQAASEFNVTRNYLDWLTQIPWGQRSAENFGIKHAMTVLDEDHYGLKDVKDRILEFIAVGKLRGTVEGKILCFVGPPGVGKTSIGKSIARALGRQYYRFSVGGLADVAEIKGHRRTYVGALPGRIIQALKKCQTENPLILIDEIDKLGRGHQGDPASALLELLDPEQNNSFLDHYLDVPVDLSKVLFVCTANMVNTIPAPLYDRMEVIQLSGYVADEKMAIADRYLAPQAKEMSGLKNVDVDLKPEAIEELINKYCRESGVRNLKKHIEKLYRKSALKIVQDIGEDVLSEEEALTVEGKEAQKEAEKDETDVKETPEAEQMEKQTTETPREPLQLKVPEGTKLEITKDNLKDYVGPPVYLSDRLFETYPPGVAMGLAYTSMGGSALFVESVLTRALSHETRAALSHTGMLKSVMKESSTVAWTFVKGFMAKKFAKNNFFRHAEIHLHFPEGAVRKDGPSAGIVMATALMSLALNRSLDSTIAMTGELTITGKVLRIGGLREKTVAARRVGCKKVLFPKDNLNDWLELPENIKSGIEGCPVEYYDEVFDIMFPDVDTEAVNKMYLKQLEDPSKSKASKTSGDKSKKTPDDARGELEGGVDGNIAS